ncbi:class I SAM-dependent methyltransferase [Marininema halotolerans]|uniref:Putative rRNA methylase n=1 Tax=Marininema halotolerans TaxID=1155944 RepID=A0A1I6SKH2_9BACL|nr:class I SAM-dependent methyltransferase [Marininema halotolerans]SFS77268.1 Putative rRNA methylase [Marininema halotolerans]
MNLASILSFTHTLVKDSLFPGAIAIDATAGNGHDTLFLAQSVGEEGQVIAFDIQSQALENTYTRLKEAKVEERVSLHQRGHQHMTEVLSELTIPQVQAIMFNLGYLPKGKLEVTTLPDTTLTAIDQSLEWLGPSGTLSLVLYTGHAGGKEEATAVLQKLSLLNTRLFDTAHYQLLNRNLAPSLALVRKKGLN